MSGKASGWAMVESGVPQGTVLGGPLYTVYNNDIEEWIVSFLRIFADDTKMARIVNNTDDGKIFQEDIGKLFEWAEKWTMEFNQAKCKVMHLGKQSENIV